MTTMMALGSIGFVIFCCIHALISKKNAMLDSRSHLEGQLKQRYAQIPLMLDVVKTHVPEYGLMLEMILNLRMKSAEKYAGKVEVEVNQDIFQMLFDLIKLPSYTRDSSSELRNRLADNLVVIEKNVVAAQNQYLCALEEYNRFADQLRVVSYRLGFTPSKPYMCPVIIQTTEINHQQIPELIRQLRVG